MAKHDVIIIGASVNGEVATLRRRYDEHDYEPEIHETLKEQVQSDIQKERDMFEELGYSDMILTKDQALKLMVQLKQALLSDLKIFGTEA